MQVIYHNVMYYPALVGPSVHWHLRLHVPVELHPPTSFHRYISILTLDCLFSLTEHTNMETVAPLY